MSSSALRLQGSASSFGQKAACSSKSRKSVTTAFQPSWALSLCLCSLEDTYYAVSVLSATKDPSLDAPKSCSWVGAYKLTDPVEVEAASALARLSALVCSQAPASLAKAEASLVSAGASATSAKEIYYAAEGLQAIKVWHTQASRVVCRGVQACRTPRAWAITRGSLSLFECSSVLLGLDTSTWMA